MTAMNGIDRKPGGAAAAALRRCAGNVLTALKMLLRPVRINTAHPWLPAPHKLGLAALVAVAVLVFGMMFIDSATADAMKYAPRWLVWFAQEITDFGKGAWFAWPLGLGFLFLAALPVASRSSQLVLAAVMVRIGYLFVAIGLPGLFASVVKNMIGRRRPNLGGISDATIFEPFHWTPTFASLPSGHATTAFAALAAIASLWPRGRTVLLIYALLIATSRVVVTAHYPTDVAASAVVGIVGVLLIRRWFALRRLGFSIGVDGQLHQYPGPSWKRIKAVARELLA